MVLPADLLFSKSLIDKISILIIGLFSSYVILVFLIKHNGKLQVVVADFEERQCAVGHDGQERNRDNAHHCPRNAICKLLATVIISSNVQNAF